MPFAQSRFPVVSLTTNSPLFIASLTSLAWPGAARSQWDASLRYFTVFTSSFRPRR
jgi:hypothetical protein